MKDYLWSHARYMKLLALYVVVRTTGGWPVDKVAAAYEVPFDGFSRGRLLRLSKERLVLV
jgi:hypothetical protein